LNPRITPASLGLPAQHEGIRDVIERPDPGRLTPRLVNSQQPLAEHYRSGGSVEAAQRAPILEKVERQGRFHG